MLALLVWSTRWILSLSLEVLFIASLPSSIFSCFKTVSFSLFSELNKSLIAFNSLDLDSFSDFFWLSFSFLELAVSSISVRRLSRLCAPSFSFPVWLVTTSVTSTESLTDFSWLVSPFLTRHVAPVQILLESIISNCFCLRYLSSCVSCILFVLLWVMGKLSVNEWFLPFGFVKIVSGDFFEYFEFKSWRASPNKPLSSSIALLLFVFVLGVIWTLISLGTFSPYLLTFVIFWGFRWRSLVEFAISADISSVMLFFLKLFSFLSFIVYFFKILQSEISNWPSLSVHAASVHSSFIINFRLTGIPSFPFCLISLYLTSVPKSLFFRLTETSGRMDFFCPFCKWYFAMWSFK